MYKKQMKIQRIACYLSIAASALVFLYALGIMTDLYDMLYTMVPVPDDPTSVKVAGAMIYYDMQGFNQSLLGASIGLILSSVLLFVTNTHSRRKYYIGNYIAIAISAVANIGVALCEMVMEYDLLHNAGYYIVLEISNFQHLNPPLCFQPACLPQ